MASMRWLNVQEEKGLQYTKTWQILQEINHIRQYENNFKEKKNKDERGERDLELLLLFIIISLSLSITIFA